MIHGMNVMLLTFLLLLRPEKSYARESLVVHD